MEEWLKTLNIHRRSELLTSILKGFKNRRMSVTLSRLLSVLVSYAWMNFLCNRLFSYDFDFMYDS